MCISLSVSHEARHSVSAACIFLVRRVPALGACVYKLRVLDLTLSAIRTSPECGHVGLEVSCVVDLERIFF